MFRKDDRKDIMETIHTCWNDPQWDGLMEDTCTGCQVAAAHPCVWCGYGHVFATHNPLAHYENGDTDAPSEDDWTDEMFNGPRMSRPRQIDVSYHEDGTVYVHATLTPFNEEFFKDILNREPGQDTRSVVYEFRLPNGDLVLGFFPTGDTYIEVSG